jgi:hypothetical protein
MVVVLVVLVQIAHSFCSWRTMARPLAVDRTEEAAALPLGRGQVSTRPWPG